MPTGYTHEIYEGTLTDWREFVIQCSSAFIRTDGENTNDLNSIIEYLCRPIEVYEFYLDRLTEKTEELEHLQIQDEAGIAAAYEHERKEIIDHYDELREKNVVVADRYNDILYDIEDALFSGQSPFVNQVMEFAVKQLTSSRDFDIIDEKFMRIPEEMPVDEWYHLRVRDLMKNIDDCKDEIRKDIERKELARKNLVDLIKALYPDLWHENRERFITSYK